LRGGKSEHVFNIFMLNGVVERDNRPDVKSG